MSSTTRVFAGALAVLLLLGWSTESQAKKQGKSKERVVFTEPLDDGKLDPLWFSESGVAFVQTDEADYFWAKEGFSFEGKTFHFKPWPEPEFLGEGAEERDENDHRLARQMNAEIERSFADTLSRVFGDKAQASIEDGDVVVEGRIVDCSTGNTAAKMLVGFGAGSGYTTVDLKFTDKATGELVAAIHHRVVSGTSWSTTDSKFFKWIRKLGEEIVDEDFGGLYEDGDRVKE